MILFNNSVMIPRLIYPVFYGFFVGFSCLVEIYPECRGVFLSRDDEKIGVFLLQCLYRRIYSSKFEDQCPCCCCCCDLDSGSEDAFIAVGK